MLPSCSPEELSIAPEENSTQENEEMSKVILFVIKLEVLIFSTKKVSSYAFTTKAGTIRQIFGGSHNGISQLLIR